MAIRILLADDHKIMAQAVAFLLEDEAGFEVAGIAASGRQAVELAEALLPDVVVMDAAMPDLSGMDATRRILSKLPDVRVLALSAYNNRGFIDGMMRSGASGYLLKHCAADELGKAIRAVYAGTPYLGQGIEAPTWKAGRALSSRHDQPTASALGSREREVLRLISEGKRNAEIASLLGLSLHTVIRHRQNIMNKLDIHSVAGLTRYAVRENMTLP